MRTISALVLIFFCGSGAANAGDVSRQLAEQGLDQSGINLFLKQTPVMLKHLLKTQNAQNDQERDLLRSASAQLQRQITFEALHKALIEDLQASGRSEYLQQMIKALNTPLAKSMNEREQEVSSADGRKRLAEYREKVSLNPPRGIRVELLARLDKASQTSEISVLLRQQLTRSIVNAAATLTQRNESEIMPANTFDDEYEKQLRDASYQQVQTFFLFAYRKVPSGQLEEYVKIYEQESSLWFVAQCITTINRFFEQQRAAFVQ